jgi:hypothetical protein
MLAGGLIGAALMNATTLAASAASATTLAATSTASPSAAQPSGTFRPNEDPAHEAGESAAREAQENAGQVPTVP